MIAADSHRVVAVAALLMTGTLTACTVSPATGERIFTGFMSPEREQQIGRAEHPKILKQFGGVYADPKIATYVNRIGQQLARRSELPNQKFTFTVLNSKQVNAFAVPGGFVYVTRGLMALANDEAELAGVIAHEIGHITARHTAQRYSQSQAVGLLGAAAGIVLGAGGSDVAGLGAQLYLRSFSREQEFEADSLGVRYIARDGYETSAMAGFLKKMRSHAQLQTRLRGGSGNQVDAVNFLSTHPRAVDRVERAVAQARGSQAANPRINRLDHMQNLHGLLFGDDPKEGIVSGRDFIHPALRFRFRVPPGFRITNGRTAVIARNRQNAIIQFDTAGKDYKGPMTSYLSNIWAPRQGLSQLERITVNGLEGATATTQIRTRGGVRDARLVAVRDALNRKYRFVFLTPPNITQQLSLALSRTTFSFKKIAAAEEGKFKPLRLKIRAVRAGETVASLAKEMAVDELPEDWIRTLNGLLPNQQPRAGQLIKLIIR